MKLDDFKTQGTKKLSGFHTNIEKETVNNKNYRKVIFTSNHIQLVLMSIQPGDEIGEEVHKVDQFIRCDDGTGKFILNGIEKSYSNGDAVIVPSGTKHNIINTGNKPLQIYTIYSSPQHLKNTLQKTKADEVKNHFDGKTDL